MKFLAKGLPEPKPNTENSLGSNEEGQAHLGMKPICAVLLVLLGLSSAAAYHCTNVMGSPSSAL